MKCTCGGTRHDHHVAATEGCECSACARLEPSEKCHAFVEVPKTPVEVARAKASENKTTTGSDHPDTAHEAAAKALPNSGTQRRMAYDLIVASGDRGMTDDELEDAMMKPHQSVSARRNELSTEELIVDTGRRRGTKSGGEASVWIAAPLDGSPIQPAFQFDEDPDIVEDAAEPAFDSRIVVLASFLAGRMKQDMWALLPFAKQALTEIGLDVGPLPTKPPLDPPMAA